MKIGVAMEKEVQPLQRMATEHGVTGFGRKKW
jgi:hypothetical protein